MCKIRPQRRVDANVPTKELGIPIIELPISEREIRQAFHNIMAGMAVTFTSVHDEVGPVMIRLYRRGR